VELGSGVGSGVGAVETRRISGPGVALAATTSGGVDFTCCLWNTVCSRRYKAIKINRIEAPLTSFRISLKFASFEENTRSHVRPVAFDAVLCAADGRFIESERRYFHVDGLRRKCAQNIRPSEATEVAGC
jgi:hypothetical protein